jgi:hypothetical protein
MLKNQGIRDFRLRLAIDSDMQRFESCRTSQSGRHRAKGEVRSKSRGILAVALAPRRPPVRPQSDRCRLKHDASSSRTGGS